MTLEIERAAQILKQGGIVAFPTETVYGLGADAMNAKAVCRVFEVKKRPEFDPLIVHVADSKQAESLWAGTPGLAHSLMRAFWPGPLTIVLPKSAAALDIVTAGLPTVAARMPRHEAALGLLKAFGGPVAAPSANLFGYTSATTAEAVREDFGNSVDFILDAGPAVIGIESTVVKIENDRLVILRPGGVPVEELGKFAPIFPHKCTPGVHPESPGQIESHYAPWTPFALMDYPLSKFLKKLRSFYAGAPLAGARAGTSPAPTWPRIGLLLFSQNVDVPFVEQTEVLTEKNDLVEAASNLFQAIRKLDKMHLDWIAAEAVPEKGIGAAIMDRLRKASGGKWAIRDLLVNDGTHGN